jgi:hypothetical protein
VPAARSRSQLKAAWANLAAIPAGIDHAPASVEILFAVN